MSSTSNNPMSSTNTVRPESLLVCPLSAVDEQIGLTGARHLVTCINGQSMIDTPAAIPADRHLRLEMNDISVPQSGLVPPDVGHIASLIAFAQSWPRDTPMVIHCWAGISRSSAAAFIALCALNGDFDETVIAQTIRKASPTAYPNRLMVQIGDQMLQRSGRMIGAIDEIGCGEMAVQGQPYLLAVDLC
jgi:predicted protein tyrosine phosphatase